MKLSTTTFITIASLATCFLSQASASQNNNKFSSPSIRGASRDEIPQRQLGYWFRERPKMTMMMMMGGSKSKVSPKRVPPTPTTSTRTSPTTPTSTTANLQFTLINQAFQQPFSSFFVMVHNNDAPPLYIRGEKATEPLAILAEDGNPQPLVNMYTGLKGVKTAFIHDNNGDGPLFGGNRTSFTVTTSAKFPFVTIASMAINTNDCFVAINGMRFDGIGKEDDTRVILDLDGLDAGSEVNNELCSSIPGPDCPEGSGNTRDGNGEGFVHVHRGFFGIGGDLSEAGYDWRNPMMRVIVTSTEA